MERKRERVGRGEHGVSKERKSSKTKRKAITYLWYNGSTSFKGGEKVEKTGVKAKREKSPKEPIVKTRNLVSYP